MVAEAAESPAVDPERDLLVWWVRKGELGAGDMVYWLRLRGWASDEINEWSMLLQCYGGWMPTSTYV